MTKKECEKALRNICETVIDSEADGYNCPRTVCDYCFSDTDILKQLIHEHFDNPPLSFDDLKVGMWVWDDLNKLYVQVDNDFNEGNGFIIIRYHEDSYNSNCERVQFEENRFYRRQKEG